MKHSLQCTSIVDPECGPCSCGATQPHALTREQVEEQLENIHLGSVGVRVKSMACIRKHDAALRLTIAQQAQRIQELEDQRIRYGPICLNCGKDKPCMTEAEANQHGASIPCIFDPAPKELWQRCEQQAQEIERLKGELGLKEEWAHLHADDVIRLKWTTARPTVAGWYWWRVNVHDTDIEVCEVSADLKGVRFVEGEWDMEQVDGEFGGEWAGPIPMPKEA